MRISISSNATSTLYRTRIDYVNALQWSGDNVDDIQKLLKNRGLDWDKRNGLSVYTEDNGLVKVPVGSWVVVSAKQKFVLSDSEFHAAYMKE